MFEAWFASFRDAKGMGLKSRSLPLRAKGRGLKSRRHPLHAKCRGWELKEGSLHAKKLSAKSGKSLLQVLRGEAESPLRPQPKWPNDPPGLTLIPKLSAAPTYHQQGMKPFSPFRRRCSRLKAGASGAVLLLSDAKNVSEHTAVSLVATASIASLAGFGSGRAAERPYHIQASSRITSPPVCSGRARPPRSSKKPWGSMPSRWKIVAAKSCGRCGRSAG